MLSPILQPPEIQYPLRLELPAYVQAVPRCCGIRPLSGQPPSTGYTAVIPPKCRARLLINLVSGDEQMRLMTVSLLPVTADDRRRWRKSLEHLGPEEVKWRLNRTTTFDPDEAVDIGDDVPPWATRSFVQDWLNEKRAKADRLGKVTLWWTVVGAIGGVIAAIAAVVAAWPVVFR